MIIHVNYSDERKSIISFSPDNKVEIKTQLQHLELQHGFDEKYHTGINSYDNEDYLFLYWLSYEANDVYERMNRNPQTGEFRPGYKKVPYIHVELTSDFVIEDKYLNAGVTKMGDIYRIRLNKYLFRQVIGFLQLIFDSNMEHTIALGKLQCVYADGTEGIAADSYQNEKLVTKNDIMMQARRLIQLGLREQGMNMMQYACSLESGVKVHMPSLLFQKDEQGKQIVDVIYYDTVRKVIVHPLKKKIFNTSSFYKWFERRNDLIQRVFVEVMQFIVTHEFAHIANGHCDLMAADEAYCKERRIALCAELNADDTAVRWRVFDLLFQGIDGNPQNPWLAYTRDELKEEWAIRGFSAYLAMSWGFREEERVWNEDTLRDFLQDKSKDHPIYQFRTYSILNRVLCSLENILVIEESQELRTKDGYMIDKAFIEAVETEIIDMINSFEAYFDETYNDNRTLAEWNCESGKVEEHTMPKNAQQVPFLMPVFWEEANLEMKKIAEPWEELRGRLEENGTYCKLYQILME